MLLDTYDAQDGLTPAPPRFTWLQMSVIMRWGNPACPEVVGTGMEHPQDTETWEGGTRLSLQVGRQGRGGGICAVSRASSQPEEGQPGVGAHELWAKASSEY